MRFDSPSLSRGWLATAQASSTAKQDILFRAVLIEEHLRGVRLVATDRRMLLTAWVPNVENLDGFTEPSLDEAPERTVIVRDTDGRGKGLLRYLLLLDKRVDPEGLDPAGTREIRMEFDVRPPAGVEVSQEGFEGMDPTYVYLDAPDQERVYLPVVEAEPPDWRAVVSGYEAITTKAVAFWPEFIQRLAGARTWADGPMVWSFGGPDKVSAVAWPESDPRVSGFVMPSKALGGEEGEDSREDDLVRILREFHTKGITVEITRGSTS